MFNKKENSVLGTALGTAIRKTGYSVIIEMSSGAKHSFNYSIEHYETALDFQSSVIRAVEKGSPVFEVDTVIENSGDKVSMKLIVAHIVLVTMEFHGNV